MGKKKKKAEEALKEKRVETTKELSCVLTPEEYAERADAMADKAHELGALEGQKKSVADDYKGRISSAEAEMYRLSNIVKNKSEFRDVKCVEVYDYKEGEYRLERLDTCEVVSRRPLRNDEKHEQLTLVDNAADKAPESEPEPVDA